MSRDIATRQTCRRGEFAVFTGSAFVFCRVESGTEHEANEVVRAINNRAIVVTDKGVPICGDFLFPRGSDRVDLCGRCGGPRGRHAQ